MSNLSSPITRKTGQATHGAGISNEEPPPRGKHEHNEMEDEESDEENPKPEKRAGRRKIKIEYIDDKSRRHITFSKRKAGIMKKAYELSTLTGTQVLLLVVSETGLVYTFTTPKLQPLVTKPEGKNLIQACLNAPDPTAPESSSPSRTPQSQNVYNDNAAQVESANDNLYPEDRKQSHQQPTGQMPPATNYAALANMGYSQAYGAIPQQMPLGAGGLSSPSYMNPQYPQYSQQHLYGTATQANQYMQQPNYWPGGSGNGNPGVKSQQYSGQPADKK